MSAGERRPGAEGSQPGAEQNEPRASRRSAHPDYRKPIDRIAVPLLTGPVGRSASFAIELGRAVVRSLRGDPRHPEERR
ncbi:MAG: hypothetical protein ACR2K6_09085 [Solirubrobacterales bacterium]